MEDYLVFARKFRPQGFEEVVGQEPIVTTLKNAIRQNRIPQNFLFSGPRGCGKTSTARILAKALNCAKGPTENPCGKCSACKEVTDSNSMDVLEIDGASNRGIDEIRNLRETVKFKPTNGRMKIYIIDEVHMLTTEAFNALLKTLEEPPAHVKFIFATTEAHKVPLTILSRCHRFHFKRIPVREIAEKLEEIAGQEKIKFEKKALFLIAKSSDGSLRDAEGMLDQLASFCDGKIGEEEVLLTLGLASEELYFSVLSALKEKDAAKIFSIIKELYETGRDLAQFSKGLLEIFRHLLLIQSLDAKALPQAASYIEMSEEAVNELSKRCRDFSKAELLLALSFLSNLQNQLRRNIAAPKLLVEMVLLKLLHLDGFKVLGENSERPREAVSGYKAEMLPRTGSPQGAPIQPQAKPVSRPIAPSPAASVRPPSPSPKEGRDTQSSGTLTLLTWEEVEGAWPRVVDYVKAKRMSTGIFLSESQPVECRETTVILGLPSEFQFHKEMLEKGTNRELIEEAFDVALGKKVRVQFVITQTAVENRAVSASNPAPAAASEAPGGKLNEILSEAMNVFDGARILRKD